MKILGISFLFMIAFSTQAAPAPRQQACEEEVRKSVLAAAKIVGVHQQIEFDVGATGDTDTTQEGETLDVYATSVFYFGNDYITGSGAVVAVMPTAKSCEIVKMNITAR